MAASSCCGEHGPGRQRRRTLRPLPLGRRRAAGSEFAVNLHTSGNQDTPALAAVPAGGFVAVWEDAGQDGDGETVVGQRFDKAGGRMGAEFRINSGTVGDQQEPALAAYAAGFVVAWVSATDDGADGSGMAVLARRFDAQGVALGDDIAVNAYTTGDQTHPVVAATGGGFVVAWSSDGQDGDAEGIFAQRFDAEGERRERSSGERLHRARRPGPRSPPARRLLPRGLGERGPGRQQRRVMGPLGRDGLPLGPEQRINVTTSGAQEDVSIAVDGRGGFVLVWESADGSPTASRAGARVAGPRFHDEPRRRQTAGAGRA
jgi:hypothetical protein